MEYIIPALLTLIVTIAAGVVLWLIKRERVILEYEIIASDQFPTRDGSGKYFIVKLLNSGNRPIANIDFALALPYGKITSIANDRTELLIDIEQADTLFKAKLPLLNPNEQLRVTVTAEGQGELPLPRLTARAIGATAIPIRDERIPASLQTSLAFLVVAVVMSGGLTLWNSWRTPKIEHQIKESLQKLDTTKLKDTISELQEKTKRLQEEQRTENENYEAGKPESQQILFAIFNKSGLSHLLPDLIQISTENGIYWKTGLLLTNKFAVDAKNRSHYITAMESLVNVEHVAPASRGFNLYLLGKMEKFVGNSSKASEYFARCKKEAPLMYDHLMEQDPFFDLKTIEKHIKTR
jgi:hypothetical protein